MHPVLQGPLQSARRATTCSAHYAHAAHQPSYLFLSPLRPQRVRGPSGVNGANNAAVGHMSVGVKSSSRHFLSISTTHSVLSRRPRPALAAHVHQATSTKVTCVATVMLNEVIQTAATAPDPEALQVMLVTLCVIGFDIAVVLLIFEAPRVVREVQAGPPTVTRLRLAVRRSVKQDSTRSWLPEDLRGKLSKIADKGNPGSRNLPGLLADIVNVLRNHLDDCSFQASHQQTGIPFFSDMLTAMETLSQAERDMFDSIALLKEAKQQTETQQRGNNQIEQPSDAASSDNVANHFLIVTLLVATKCSVKLPKDMDRLAGLRQLLDTLIDVSSSFIHQQVEGVELYWSPEVNGCYYAAEEVVADFPDMQPVTRASYGGLKALAREPL